MFLLILAIVLVRAHGRMIYPDFWAEDGGVYFTDVLANGFSSLFVPYAGYYHGLAKLFTYLIVKILPLSLWAIAAFWGSTLLFVWSAWLFTSKDYEWLIPSQRQRNWTAALFTLTPGMNEVIGNIANTNWILFWVVAAIALKNPAKRIRAWELLFILLVSLSIGTAILIVPLFIWRAFYEVRNVGDQKAAARSIVAAVFLFAGAGLISYSLFYLKPADNYEFNYDKVAGMRELLAVGPDILFKQIQKSVIFRPWLGSGLATALNDFGKLPVLAVLATLAIWGLLVNAFRDERRRAAAMPVAIFLVCIAAWALLRAIGRPGSLDVPYWIGNNYWAHRYSYPLGFGAILFWMILLGPVGKVAAWQRRLFAFFILLNLVHGMDRIFIRAYQWTQPNYPHAALWSGRYQPLESALKTGCPKEVKVLIYPHPWAIYYTSPKSDCP